VGLSLLGFSEAEQTSIFFPPFLSLHDGRSGEDSNSSLQLRAIALSPLLLLISVCLLSFPFCVAQTTPISASPPFSSFFLYSFFSFRKTPTAPRALPPFSPFSAPSPLEASKNFAIGLLSPSFSNRIVRVGEASSSPFFFSSFQSLNREERSALFFFAGGSEHAP